VTAAAAVAVTLAAGPAGAAIEVAPDYQVLAPIQSITAVDRNLLQQRVERAWALPGLGDRKALAIDAFASEPQPEVDLGADQALMPASTTKLLTAAAVLKALGPQARFTTSVTRQGSQVFLVGGGDPQLTSAPGGQGVNADASLARLARQTAAVLAADGVTTVRLRYDDTLFAPPAEQPYWRKDFLAIGVVAPITALMVDGGRLNPPASPRSPQPSLTAAQVFARLLEQRGIEVSSAPQPAQAQGSQIAFVDSAPLADLVEHMLLVSDNTEAEVLAHHAGLEILGDPTFAGGAKATVQALDELGVDTDGLVLNDGSGLSRANRITPAQLLAVLRAAIQTDPDALWPIYTGLPVAGFDGSLAARFATPAAAPGRGAASGKTGTLTGTSTLAGLVVDRDDQLLTYAVMTNGVSVWSASPAIDAVVARIAGCRCAGAAEIAP
jgi:D-alanyl-D-alanine carboxypeptidase/D-alanyl-D-alanine-endopeptidase (penicillin-binding protein 4)